jgi:phosphate transport system substrate-binding protein
MKTPICYIAIALLLTVSVTQAQTTVPALTDTITITGTRFTFPLVQQWITAFKKEHPGVTFRLISPREAAAANADIHITAQHIAAADKLATTSYIEVARYALLPVANSKNIYAGQPLKVKTLRTLYFEDDGFKKKGGAAAEPTVTVYNRLEKSCAPVTFAAFYGSSFEEIKGKSVVGDDQHLLQAVQEDPNGISFNNPGFIYDLHNRKPVNNIAVIPIDLNDNGKLDADEDFYANLDVLIQRLETAPPAAIPVEGVTFAYNRQLEKSKPAVRIWIQYILEQGQQQLHAFGFLKQDQQQLAKNKLLVLNPTNN